MTDVIEMIDPVPGEIIDQQQIAEQLLAQAKEQGVSLVGPGGLLGNLTRRALGMEPVPSTASLSRILRDAGVAKVEPRKIATVLVPAIRLSRAERVLAARRNRIRPRRRPQVRHLPAYRRPLPPRRRVPRRLERVSESGERRREEGVAAHGVLQGCSATTGRRWNPSRGGARSQRVAYLRSLGVEPITGKP